MTQKVKKVHLGFYADPDEAKQIRELAKKCGCTVSSFLRFAALTLPEDVDEVRKILQEKKRLVAVS